MLEDEVEVAVVVEDPTARHVGAGSDQQVGWRQTMVPDPREIVLCLLGGAFDGLINREMRESPEALHPFAVFGAVLG